MNIDQRCYGHQPAQDQLDALRNALQKCEKWILDCDFKGHHQWCGIRIYGSYGTCTCGLTTLLQNIRMK